MKLIIVTIALLITSSFTFAKYDPSLDIKSITYGDFEVGKAIKAYSWSIKARESQKWALTLIKNGEILEELCNQDVTAGECRGDVVLHLVGDTLYFVYSSQTTAEIKMSGLNFDDVNLVFFDKELDENLNADSDPLVLYFNKHKNFFGQSNQVDIVLSLR
jgi:hypothetical protein